MAYNIVMEDTADRENELHQVVGGELENAGHSGVNVKPVTSETSIPLVTGLGEIAEEGIEAAGVTIEDILRPAIGGSVIGTTENNNKELGIVRARLRDKAGEEEEVVDRGSSNNK